MQLARMMALQGSKRLPEPMPHLTNPKDLRSAAALGANAVLDAQAAAAVLGATVELVEPPDARR